MMKRSIRSILIVLIAGSLLSGLWIVRPILTDAADPAKPAISAESIPYHSSRFDQVLAESRKFYRPGESRDFYAWMSDAYAHSKYRFPGKEKLAFEQLLRIKRADMAAIADKNKRAEAEIALGAWVHRLIKTVIPRFSLDRGFEFFNVMKYGERQCFLQSVLIAGLLQGMGVDAGAVMVYRNPVGQESNNGHAVVLVKLSNGRDIVVDASEQVPFARHQGLFVRASGYRYVEPVYARGSNKIISYRAGSQTIPDAKVRPLDFGFIRSQFWYYRGERAKDGLLAPRPTRQGLASSASALETSVKLCPGNPLAVYMLGRTYRALGKPRLAEYRFQQAAKLYATYGWVPRDVKPYASR